MPSLVLDCWQLAKGYSHLSRWSWRPLVVVSYPKGLQERALQQNGRWTSESWQLRYQGGAQQVVVGTYLADVNSKIRSPSLLPFITKSTASSWLIAWLWEPMINAFCLSLRRFCTRTRSERRLRVYEPNFLASAGSPLWRMRSRTLSCVPPSQSTGVRGNWSLQ